jgi:multimeric flavodoxin WrbA
MTEVNVVVVFYTRHGKTEELALAAGLGAVQARANIRLRRLQDLADADTVGLDALWTENRQRMTADYIAPREIDADWADVILVASCPESPGETEEYIKAIAKKQKLQIVAVIDDPSDRLASARAQGRQAVEAVRQRKGSKNP